MATVALHEGLKKIGDECFYNIAMKYLAIPKNVKIIGENIFHTYENTTLVNHE